MPLSENTQRPHTRYPTVFYGPFSSVVSMRLFEQLVIVDIGSCAIPALFSAVLGKGLFDQNPDEVPAVFAVFVSETYFCRVRSAAISVLNNLQNTCTCQFG